MDKKLSRPKRFSGHPYIPPDKSITHRAVLLASLCQGVSTIRNPLAAADCLSTLRCVEQLGCKVEKTYNAWKIKGRGLWGYRASPTPLDCGNSGTTMRLISGILSAQDFSTELIGDASLSKRPMDRVATPLSSMGAHFSLTNEKFAPLKIQGEKHLKAIHWKNPVSSAQVKSAVLLAALHAEGETTFEEPFLSRDHTERMLAACGVKIKRKGNAVSVKGPAKLIKQNWVVPGDFSSAAFFGVAALLIPGAEITMSSVNLNPTRTGLLHVLTSMGAQIKIKIEQRGGEPVGEIVVHQQKPLLAGRVDETMAPHLIDEIPILAVAATQATGVTEIRGVGELRVKETDRIKALAQNLSAMGAHVREEQDGLLIEGPTPLHGAVVDSFDDHRIAMSMAVAALIADGPTKIKNAECVDISFPTFWNTLQQLIRS